jgi:sec-independent protein translocase protein TatC
MASQPLIQHLLELRSRLLKIFFSIAVMSSLMLYWANDIYHFIAQPLMQALPSQNQMIAIDVTAPLLAPFKLTLYLSFFISIPIIFYHLWHFIAPGLYQKERKIILPILIASTTLFYSGVAFAYFIVFPLIFAFFTQLLPDDIRMATDITSYLNFVLKLFLGFGLAFEIPVAVIILCWLGVTNVQALKQKRPYLIVVAFILGMLLTPPDMISQSLLAIPMILLFELGLLMAPYYQSKHDESDSEAKSSMHP